MSQGYQQTFLFDCSRLGSEEFNGSTLDAKQPSRFTNKVSSGIKLDVGDQVSVHSAYISERGAGGDVIEFKGKPLNALNEINFTTTTDSIFTRDTKITPFGFSKQTNSNASLLVPMKDNEASIVISYYKNTNGENYNGLPRDWGDYERSGVNTSAAAGSQLLWDQTDGCVVGAQPVDRNASHYLPDDFQLKKINLNGSDGNVTKIEARPFVRNNNDRFTIFCFDEIIWNGSDLPVEDVIEYCKWETADTAPTPSVQDPSPALRKYIKFKTKIDLSVDKGYNAPSNVALGFTDKLGSITRRYIPTDVAAFVQESETLKAFPAANIDLFSRENASSYFGEPAHKGLNYANASFSNYKSIDYLSCYAYVGFKRPEFIERGRELNDFYGFRIEGSPANPESDLLTNIPWNFDSLTKLKNFFEVQHDIYPELIKRQVTRGVNDAVDTLYQNYTNGSDNFLEEARFLHMDNASHLAGFPLGNDLMNGSSAGTGVKDQSSMPIFVYFNNSSSDIIYNENDPKTLNNDGALESDLVFGFATRWLGVDGNPYVSFRVRPIGGYSNWQGRSTMGGRRIGYDYHFNAYGNAAIQLTSGYAPCSYYGQETFGSGSHLASGSDITENRYSNSVRQVYVGANTPLLNFDTVETRFAFSDLHSPEQVGNFWNAGRTQGSDVQFAPPIAAGTGPVYHINKTLEYNTYSPHMLPYPSINVTARVGSASGQDYAAGFLPLSQQLEPGVIYDSHCGITIESFGFDEVHWEEGLWGILGFSYSQFQGSNNLQTRFTNDTTNVSGATTNALITSADTKELMTSVWGTNLFNQQVPSIMRYNFDGAWIQGSASLLAFNASVVHPSITVAQTSSEIKAENLPRKQLRGYFLIKSDILSDANYFKEADPMPVFAVIDKYNAEGDFINYSGGGPTFTVTHPKQLTDITTSILDPDGTDAVVSDYSAVVYRVDKSINTNLLVAQDVLKNS